DAGEHLDVCSCGEELVACTRQDDYVSVVVHASLEDRVVELAIHLIGVGVCGRIAHLDHGNSAIGTIVDQLLRGFSSCRLHCCSHVYVSFGFFKYSNPLSFRAKWGISVAVHVSHPRLFPLAVTPRRKISPISPAIESASASTRGLCQV